MWFLVSPLNNESYETGNNMQVWLLRSDMKVYPIDVN